MSTNDPNNPYATPITADTVAASSENEGDSTGGIIPYKNPPALIAYYLGLLSLLPCLGLFAAVPALILGIMGLKKRRENPVVKGSVHAWIGIILGGLFTLIWGAAIVLTIFAGVSETW